jgi:hypothetical protein
MCITASISVHLCAILNINMHAQNLQVYFNAVHSSYVITIYYRIDSFCKYYVSGHYPSSCFYLKHCPVFISKHNISETAFCLCLQVKPIQLGPINRSSPYL